MAFHSYRESLRGFVVLERGKLGLETRARSLGWENVIVIDDDLGA